MHKWAVIVVGVMSMGAGAACGKGGEAPKATEAPPSQVVAAASEAPAPAVAASTTPVAAREAKLEAKAEGAAHEGCGEHAHAAVAAAAEPAGHAHAHAVEGDGEKDCPFPHGEAGDKGGACGEHAVAVKVEGGAQHFGEAFALSEAKPLAEVLGAAKADGEQTVRVAGTIEKVCQKKGCWMVVKDGELEARVIMKGHAFAVPKDAAGQKAVVEGALQVRVFTEAQAKHLAEDGGEDPTKVTGEKKEFLLTATAVQIGG